jgi:hypothetical protein
VILDKESLRDEEISAVFTRAYGVIDSTLVSHYRVPKEDAARLEQELFKWFHRFSRRPGSPHSIKALRPHLLLMACQAGHVYWIGRLDGGVTADEHIHRTLTLGPQEIAIELEKHIEDRERENK